MNTKKTKISIVGAGYVGATCAYSLMISGLPSEIVIVDIDKDKSLGEAMDLSHGVSLISPVNVHAGDYSDTKDSDIVIITAGAAQKPGETRLDLINKNCAIFKNIIPNIVKYNPDCILLVVSNPVDILTYITYKLSGFPKERVIGSGTVLDTSRFKYMLSEHFDIDARNVHAYIMGEHGDSEIATWSSACIAGMSINDYSSYTCKKFDDAAKTQLLQNVRDAAYDVIQKKGATYFAVALAVKRIVEAILRDENSILTTSCLLEGQYGIDNIYMGIPSIIGSSGVKELVEVPLSGRELKEFINSAKTLKDCCNKLEF